MHLAVVLGAAVTSAVLTGALLVGDSVRGSLRDLTLERLGEIDFAYVSERFIREEVASEMAGRLGETADEVVPALILQGTATQPDSKRRASNVSVIGIDDRFPTLYGPGHNLLETLFAAGERENVFPPLAVNQSLADELHLQTGDPVLLSFALRQEGNPEFALGRRDEDHLLGTLRGRLAEVVPDASLGRFALQNHQSAPRNLFLPLTSLQQELDRGGKINTLLVSIGADFQSQGEWQGTVPERGEEAPGAAAETGQGNLLDKALQGSLKLEDYGLILRPGEGGDAVMESLDLVISPPVEEVVREAAGELGLSVTPVFTYLANRLEAVKGTVPGTRELANRRTAEPGNSSVPYSTVAALDIGWQKVNGLLELSREVESSGLGPNEILLNEWTARELGIEPGDRVSMTYYTVGWQEELRTETAEFQVAGVVAMRGLALDQTLAPLIPGIDDARSMSSWDPPVPIDLGQIRPADEEYWEEYRTAPKAFFSFATGRELWESRFGGVTSFRFSAEQEVAGRFEGALLSRLSRSLPGAWIPVKQAGLESAAGATDFGGLFIGFSLFLIVSAVLLSALLFRLGVELRAREIGIRLALGFPMKRVRRAFLMEGALLALLGSMIGLLGGVAYAAGLVEGLRTIWVTAVGGAFLSLHVTSLSLGAGLAGSFLAVIVSIILVFRDMSRRAATELLAGQAGIEEVSSGRVAKWSLAGSLLLALGLIAAALAIGAESSAPLFFGIGACLLIAGQAAFSLWLSSRRHVPVTPEGRWVLLRTSLRNAARNRGRSLLCTALVASATFVIVAVGAHRSNPGEEIWDRDSGAGGFGIRAESDIPLVRDLGNSDALYDLGFSDQEIDSLAGLEVMSFRLLPGEDMSCRNLYQPGRPRVLGVPQGLINRGGFTFQGLERDAENPWELLNQDFGPGVVPAFGDANSVMWILHKGLGQDVLYVNERGEEIRLRIVGLLSRSIFQSELLISENSFQRHFPGRSGYSYFLVGAPPEKVETVSTVLEDRLSPFGFDAALSSQVLAGFLAIENTYLSTFQMLGGLGLLLGTLGLAIILVRNTNERSRELATLRAFGFPAVRLARMIFAEHCLLLALGIALGTVAALIAVAPHLAAHLRDVPWPSLAITLLGILAAGSLVTSAAVQVALRRPLLTELKQE